MAAPGENVVDLDELRRNLGDDDLLQHIVSIYLEDCVARLATLKSRLAARNLACLALEAHSLKGASRNMGADRMVSACSALESSARGQHLERLDAQVAQVELEYLAVSAALTAPR